MEGFLGQSRPKLEKAGNAMLQRPVRLFIFSLLFTILFGCGMDENPNDELLEISEVQQEVLGPVTIKSGDMNVLLYGCFSSSRLRWTADGSCIGPYFYGSNLSAQHKWTYNGGNTQVNDPWDTDKLEGQCVSLVRSTASYSGGIMPYTGTWSKGTKVLNGGISIGTAIATFNGGWDDNGVWRSYGPKGNDHTGFFAGYSGSSCFWIFDQNYVASLTVGKHTICVTNSGTTGDANAYYVVNVP